MKMEGSLYKQLFDLTQMALGGSDDNQNLENIFNNIKEAFKELEELRAYKRMVQKAYKQTLTINTDPASLTKLSVALHFAIMGDEAEHEN